MDQAVLEPQEKKPGTPPGSTPPPVPNSDPANSLDSAPTPATSLQARILNAELPTTPEEDLSKPPTFILPALQQYAGHEEHVSSAEEQASTDKAFAEKVEEPTLLDAAISTLSTSGVNDIASSIGESSGADLITSQTLDTIVDDQGDEMIEALEGKEDEEEAGEGEKDADETPVQSPSPSDPTALNPDRRYEQAPGNQFTEDAPAPAGKAHNPANGQNHDNKSSSQTEEDGSDQSTEKKGRFQKTNAAREKLRETRQKYQDTKSELRRNKEEGSSPAAQARKNEIKQAKKLLQKQLVREAAVVVWAFILETMPIWLPLLLMGIIILAVTLFIMNRNTNKLLNKPPATIPAEPGGFRTSSLNPEGLHLPEGVQTLSIVDARGVTRRLELETDTAIYVNNGHDYTINGCTGRAAGTTCYRDQPGRGTAFWTKYVPSQKKTVHLTDDEVKWGVNMRWPYQYNIPFVGEPDYRSQKPGLKEMYGGRRIVMYNLDNHKAAVAVISEYGPQPQVGVCEPIGTNNTYPGNPYKKGPENTCEAEKASWDAPGRKGATGDFRLPSNFTGYSIEGTIELTKALDAKNFNRIALGFLPVDKEDSTPLGPMSDPKPVKANKTITAAGAVVSLKVPGVNQTYDDGCGTTSASMVALYYHLEKGGRAWNGPDDYPPSIKDLITPIPGATNDSNAFYNTKDVCNLFVAGEVKAVPNAGNWGVVHMKDIEGTDAEKRKRIFNAITASLRAKDPVIVYTKPGTMYSRPHIMVITGYDGKNGFIWNNPVQPTVQKNITGTPGMQWPALFDNLGGQEKTTNILAINLDHIQKVNNTPISALPDDPQ